MHDYPLVSIIIPSYNSFSHAREFFDSLLKTTYPNYEVVVVDDNSTDGTKELLLEQSAKDHRIKVFFSQQHLGIPKSRNYGLSLAHGEYTAFAELDMKFEPDWLSAQIKVLSADPQLGGTMGVVLDADNPKRIQAVGLKLIPQTGWVVNIGLGEDKDKFDYSSVEYVSVGAVGSVFRTSILKIIKGNDDHLIRNVEDVDMGWRVWIAGYKIKFVKNSVLYHVTSKDWAERKNSTPFKHDVGLSQITRMILKNYEPYNVLIYFPQAIVILALRAIVNLARGNTSPLKAFVYVLYWTIKTLPSTLSERKHIQKTRGFSDKEIAKYIMADSNIIRLFRSYHAKLHQKLGAITASQNGQCPICEAPRHFAKMYSVKNPRQEIQVDEFTYKKCQECGFIKLFPELSKEEMQKIYSNEEYYKLLSQPVKNKLIQRIITLKISETYVDFVSKHVKSPTVLLDIGCGNGDFLNEAEHKGYSVYGLDPYRVAVDKTSEKIGKHKVFQGNIIDLSNLQIDPDVITMWHVLEHVESPVAEVKLIASELKPGGYFCFEVPGGDSLLMKYFKKYYNHNMIPEHALYFTQDSIRLLLSKTGFEVITIHNPPKALLNFALSLNEYLKHTLLPSIIRNWIFIASIPVSVFLVLVETTLNRGELIRVAARKK